MGPRLTSLFSQGPRGEDESLSLLHHIDGEAYIESTMITPTSIGIISFSSNILFRKRIARCLSSYHVDSIFSTSFFSDFFFYVFYLDV